MEKAGEFMASHPVLTGAACAVLMGWAAYSVFRIGFVLGVVYDARGDAARAASEALGG